MSDVTSILLVGVGGQGTILVSSILSRGLVTSGFDVKTSEIHGMAQRGGSVSTHVRFGEKVYSPIVGRGGADIAAGAWLVVHDHGLAKGCRKLVSHYACQGVDSTARWGRMPYIPSPPSTYQGTCER